MPKAAAKGISAAQESSDSQRWLRWIPLSTLTLLLFAYCAYSKDPGVYFQARSFQLNADLSAAAMARALTKTSHWVHFAITYGLAFWAIRGRSFLIPLGISLGIGFLVELEEGFVVGRGARLADLLPDLLGFLVAMVAIFALRRSATRRPQNI